MQHSSAKTPLLYDARQISSFTSTTSKRLLNSKENELMAFQGQIKDIFPTLETK